MRRRVIYGLLIAALGANLVIGAKMYLGSAQAAEKDSAYPNLELFSYVMEKVRKDYVDGQKLTYQELVYGALKGMLNTLDPHSEFMVPEKYKELQNDIMDLYQELWPRMGIPSMFSFPPTRQLFQAAWWKSVPWEC